MYDVKTIDYNKISAGKKTSGDYMRNYGNDVLEQHFRGLDINARDSNSDAMVFNFLHYVIRHYEAYQTEFSSFEKQTIFFNICRSVSFLTNNITTGTQSEGVVDQYVLKNKYGFEDSNIFRDLKFLQILNIYIKPRATSPSFWGKVSEIELVGLMQDLLHPLKELVELELNSSLSASEKTAKRKEYQDVKKYPNIFSIASYYREQDKCQQAIQYLNQGIEFLQDENQPEDKLLVALRTISVIGEFASQKNLSLMTRLNHPKLLEILEKIKLFADKIVKPENFSQAWLTNGAKIDFDKLLEEFSSLKSDLAKILVELKNLTSYDARFEYYVGAQEAYQSKKLALKDSYKTSIILDSGKLDQIFMKEESIKDITKVAEATKTQSIEKKSKLEVFIQKWFSDIQIDEEAMKKILLSDKPIAEIKKMVKDTNKFKHLMQNPEYRQDEEVLKKGLEKIAHQHLKIVDSTSALEATSALIESVLKSDSIIVDKRGLLTETFQKFCAFLSPITADQLRFQFEDDNPMKMEFSKLHVDEDSQKLSIKFKFLPGSSASELHISLDIPDDKLSAIKDSVAKIKASRDGVLHLPKRFLGLDNKFVTKAGLSQDTVLGLSSHPDFLDYLIELGQLCQLYSYLSQENIGTIAEFYLITIYGLCKEDQNLGLSHEQEFRSLRHGIRHFDDNLLVTEVESDIVGIYAHYTRRLFVELSEQISSLTSSISTVVEIAPASPGNSELTEQNSEITLMLSTETDVSNQEFSLAIIGDL
jgi:hypothetical protein